MERAEATGKKTKKFYEDEPEELASWFEVMTCVRADNPERFDALTEGFSDGSVHPEEYWKRMCELIEMWQVVRMSFKIDDAILRARKKNAALKAEQEPPQEAGSAVPPLGDLESEDPSGPTFH